MKKLLFIIILFFVSYNSYSQERIDGWKPQQFKTDHYDTLRLRKPFITPSGDTCQLLVKNDSVCIVCNSLDTLRIDNTNIFDKIYVNKIGSNSSDSIIVDSTIYFANGIKIKTNTESFSVSKTISFADQHDAQMTITNNTVITITNVPEGSNPQLSLIWSGGDYTASISGATQMSGNSTISLQETNGATDLVQFKNINGTVYYAIINVVTP